MIVVEVKGSPEKLKEFIDALGAGVVVISVTKTKSAGSYLVVHT